MDPGPKLPMSTENTLMMEPAGPQTLEEPPELLEEQYESIYEIFSCAEWIKRGEYRSVALQFPDDLLCHSVRVSELLEKQIGFKPFILADTSYGSCCVDEVAAQHVNAECILHFGDSCMSASEGRIPVKYVFPKLPFNEHDFCSQLGNDSTITDTLASGSVTLIIDVCASHVSKTVTDAVNKCLPNPCPVIDLVEYPSPTVDSDVVIFVGETQSSPRLTLLMMANPGRSFITYDLRTRALRRENTDVNRMLRRRLYVVEKAKDASVIGIVVGALSVGGYLQVVDRMKSLCRTAGKKYVVLSIGKINVAKLSNFADTVDVFVWISCPFNIMLETSDYPLPIVTPFELEVACDPTRRWYADSGWITDFRGLLQDHTGTSDGLDYREMESDMSLITGRLRRLPGDDQLVAVDGSVVPRSEALQVQSVSVESRFAERSWRGLDEKLGETEVALVREGRRGIASGYENEGCNSQSVEK